MITVYIRSNYQTVPPALLNGDVFRVLLAAILSSTVTVAVSVALFPLTSVT
jgi:hypothetical protein